MRPRATDNTKFSWRFLGSLFVGRRGAVAVWFALTLLPTLMLVALGLDEGQGTLSKIKLQRSADVAAIAGGLRAASTAIGVPTICTAETNRLACAQASAAADLAEVNAVTGAVTRTWLDSSKTLSDNLIQAAAVAGIKNAGDAAIKVTVSQPLPSLFAFPVDGQLTYTVSATAVAEVIGGSYSGTQPCMTALSGYGQGVTTQIDISISGNASLTMNGCSLRSNERIALSGNVNLVATGIYADNTITSSGNAHITGTQFPNSGQIADPYANNPTVKNAFAVLTTQTSNSFSGGGSPPPGVYSSMNLTSNTTLSPGLYVITGSLSVSGNTAVNGTGVTIVSGGSVSISGNSNFNVTAPGVSATNGAIPGILIANNGTIGGSISGNASSAISGVVYFPNSNLSFSGNGATNGQSNCLEVIASSVTITGNTNMGGNCAQFGAASFGSLQTDATVQLVQ